MKSKRSSRDPALRYARLCRFFGVSAIYFVIVVCTSGIFREMGAGALGLVVDAVLLAAGYFLMRCGQSSRTLSAAATHADTNRTADISFSAK